MNPIRPACALVLALLLVTPMASWPEEKSDKTAKSAETPAGESAKEDKAIPEAKVWTSRHQIRLGGKPIDYEATTGTLQMKNDKDEPIALFGFTAYVRQGQDARTRPIIFAYNGGPGSASAWLHMGILGPRRTALDDQAINSRGPFRLVDNEFALLDRADIVMIDPVGTGFSKPVGDAEGKDFWGVDNDIRSVSDFIVRYLNQYGRWASPKYLLGESYGGVRSGGVSYDLLTRHNVALNGIILVSPFLDYANGFAGLSVDQAMVNYISTYAATAWYHKALEPRPPELLPFLHEVEAWVASVYAPVLVKGSRATAEERQSVLVGLARYTGVSADYWDKANLRMDEGHFLQELLRSRGITVGRIDSRIEGGMPNRLAETMVFDPFDAAVAPAIVATFNDYVRRELNVDTDQTYVLSGGLWKDWDFGHVQPDTDGFKVASVSVLPDLAWTMNMNPNMKILVHQGYFDLACPYASVEYAIDHLNISPELRANVQIQYYEAGHMMYVQPAAMPKFRDATAAFIDATVN